MNYLDFTFILVFVLTHYSMLSFLFFYLKYFLMFNIFSYLNFLSWNLCYILSLFFFPSLIIWTFAFSLKIAFALLLFYFLYYILFSCVSFSYFFVIWPFFTREAGATLAWSLPQYVAYPSAARRSTVPLYLYRSHIFKTRDLLI